MRQQKHLSLLCPPLSIFDVFVLSIFAMSSNLYRRTHTPDSRWIPSQLQSNEQIQKNDWIYSKQAWKCKKSTVQRWTETLFLLCVDIRHSHSTVEPLCASRANEWRTKRTAQNLKRIEENERKQKEKERKRTQQTSERSM